VNFNYRIFFYVGGKGREWVSVIECDASVNRYGYRLISVHDIVASWGNTSLLGGGNDKILALSAQLQDYLKDHNLTICTSVNLLVPELFFF